MNATASASPSTVPQKPGVKRRQFLKSSAIGAGVLILPKIKLFGAGAPSNKLNIALIATGHRAQEHFAGVSKENVVAICDVNEDHLASAAKKFPGAKHYIDWRQCLDQKDVEAIVCCTLDHTHAFVTNWALNRDKHVYCEKPLVNSIEEARLIRQTWLKHKNKVATQVGTQRHQHTNFNRVKEMIRDGVIGKLEEVSAFGNRIVPRPGYLPSEGEAPKNIHYDLWLGPSPFHPYNSEYFKGGCLHWNMHWDWGTGQVGDMGSHTMDLAWNAMDATLPTAAEGKGDPFNPEVTPVKLQTHFDIPANNWRGPLKVSWYQGGAFPECPYPAIDLNKVGHGVVFEGSSGALIADFTNRLIFPQGNENDLTYYKPRPKSEQFKPMGNFQQEWISACKGNLKTSCDFGYATDMIEMMLLGLVAYRVGKKIKYDGAAGRVLDCSEANELLSHAYRPGWTLNG
ncbi:MAG TPA: Gfo/Idh/MocA family oxidoreductase [Candidatus Dormibacteraeota bacterium]|nr:Gfo/Idh/MocA family oxidoreductase [Candidatus Dormibacteraeota bacterium]